MSEGQFLPDVKFCRFFKISLLLSARREYYEDFYFLKSINLKFSKPVSILDESHYGHKQAHTYLVTQHKFLC